MRSITRKKLLDLFLILLIFLITLIISGSLLLAHLLDLNNYQSILTSTLQKQLNRQIRLGNSRFSWGIGPEFCFNDIYIQERGDGGGSFLTAGKISFRLKLLPLFKKRLELREVLIDNARINLLRDREGVLNIADLLQASGESPPFDLQTRGVRLRNATISWHDQTIKGENSRLTLSGLNFSLDRLKKGKKSSFKLSTTLEGSSPNSINLSGSITPPTKGDLLKHSVIDAKLDINRLEYWRFWDQLKQRTPFPSPGGDLSVQLKAKGGWEELAATGNIRFNRAVVNWPTVFRKPVSPAIIQLGINLHWNKKNIDISNLQLKTDGFSLNGSLKLSDLGTKDPHIAVKASTESFDYREVKGYIPFGIIADDAADFIENRIRGGLFRLTNGALNGRFSTLAKFGQNDNAKALYIYGTADNAEIQYGTGTPTFRQIKGNLEMKGSDFNLVGMSGLFGTAPFTLDGSIKDYATEGVPSRYPFSMTISPRPAEVAWLAAHAGAERLQFSGNSTTATLRGEGTTSLYKISGEWLLATASYSYPAVVSKPAGINSSLNFSLQLDHDATRFKSVSYMLEQLKLAGNGALSFKNDTPQLSFELASNRFHLNQQLPVIPEMKRYHPDGTVQAHVSGNGDPRSLDSMLFSGAIDLGHFSLHPHPDFKPIKNINTRISFKGNALETDSINIRYGNSQISARGRILNLKDKELELFIRSPLLDPADFGLDPAEKPPKIRNLSALLGYKGNLLTLHNLTGKLPETALTASGKVRFNKIPEADLRIAASHLKLEEIIALVTCKSAHPERVAPVFRLNANLFAESGRYLETSFNRLSTSLTMNENDIFRVKGLNASTMGGKLLMDGQLAPGKDGKLAWEADFMFEKVKAGDLLELFGIKRDISSIATLQGSLKTSGNQLDEMKKGLNGVMSLELERGVIKRFRSLAKLISVLNISQLFSFKLPDMSKDGMPFNKISSTIEARNGLLSTHDLFVDSNVMHMDATGTVDLGKEELNLLIGVQPLQTVDKLINRIPVVGWLLTGGDGSLITTYFEVQGNWSNPDITAIPVQGMATGTLDILRRAVELPVRIFTDSDKVLLGNKNSRQKADLPVLEFSPLQAVPSGGE